MTAHASTEESPGWLTLANRHTGERLQLRRVWQEGELCLELKGTLPPHHDGPPLHIHYWEHEEGTVSAGTLGAEVDGRQTRIKTGGTARLPMGSVHRWWNAGDDLLTFEGTAKPLVDLDVYLRAAFEVMNSGSPKRPPLFYIAHLAWRHRKTQRVLIGPRWIQAVVFPTIVLVGTLLGRYRGTSWPGCPERCTAAPVVA
jgi:quercetin dioxygenase-like cupin family protein